MLQAILPHFDEVVLTRFLTNPRSVPPDQLLNLATEIQPTLDFSPLVHTAEGPGPAIEIAKALAGPAGVVVITGSIFLAAEARGLLLLPANP
jgi:dihydrofolate synthase/folylpolyglutamate synthase